MRRLLFYCETIDTECVLEETESHHLSRVLRIGEGEPIEVFDGQGTLAQGTVRRIEKHKVILQTTHVTRTGRPENGRLILAVSFAKGQRFDWMVEKCTELGADHIAAIQFDRTVKLGSENTIERFKKISLAAVKQCGRLFLPEFSGPAGFTQTLSYLKKLYPSAVMLCGDPRGKQLSTVRSELVNRDLILLIGPEGGFSSEETQWLSDQKIETVSIHHNVLRIETAAVAFCSVLRSL